MKTPQKIVEVMERPSPFDKALINADVMFTRFKAVAVSVRPRSWEKAHNADTLERFFRRAARRNPDIIVAPEGVLEGYVITDVIWHRERAVSLLDIAEPLDGPYIKRFRMLARELKTCLCFGFAERIGREVYNSAVFIDGNGDVCGTYRKVSEMTHASWRFSRQGKEIRPFDTPLGRCGILICSDRWAPLIARAHVLAGAQFLLIPTYGSTGREQTRTVVSRARENGVPIVQANVGMGMIVSRGEIVSYKWGLNTITAGFIDIPVRPSKETARACEREFMKFQPKPYRNWYRRKMTEVEKNSPSRDERKLLLDDRKFFELRETRWGEEKPGNPLKPGES